MTVRRKVGRFGVLLGGALLTAGALVLPSSTQSAQAQDACTPDWETVAGDWNVMYDDRGVTLCRTSLVGTSLSTMQIVDLAAGAKVRLISDHAAPRINSYYNKRQASEWFDWIPSNTDRPSPALRFSTTNASFFTLTSEPVTPFALPHTARQWYPDCPPLIGEESPCEYTHTQIAVAFDSPDNPDWHAPKRMLTIGDPDAQLAEQDVEIGAFPTHYDILDVFDGLTKGGASWDGTVGFDPLYEASGPGDESNRTYAAVNGSKLYILTMTGVPVVAGFTVDEAKDVIESFAGSSANSIQLDGGGSTQMYADWGEGPLDISSYINRPVPDVLAVYLSPSGS